MHNFFSESRFFLLLTNKLSQQVPHAVLLMKIIYAKHEGSLYILVTFKPFCLTKYLLNSNFFSKRKNK